MHFFGIHFTKISGTLKSDTYQEDIIKFQSDIDKVTEWTEIWKMELNQKKCKVMHFGKNNKQHNYYMTDPITKTQTTLSKSTAERDLGIIITTNLKSTIQANKADSKANSILGLMKRTFVSRNVPLWKNI